MPDPGPIGSQAAFFMDELEQEYEHGFYLGDVLIVAEIHNRETGETTIHHSCSSERVVVAMGMVELMRDSLRAGRREDDDA